MFLLTFAIWLTMSEAERPQIGHFPIKGNLWRAKFPEEIRQTLSDAFLNFSQNCIKHESPETGIRYYVSEGAEPYENIETDNSICVYSLERNLPNAKNYYSPDVYKWAHNDTFGLDDGNFTVYFACDDYCCGLECCQRDVGMTIVGFTLISVSAIIVLFYAAIYCGGMLCAWRNGALGKKLQLQFNGKSPDKKRKYEETSMTVLRANDSVDTANGGPV